MPTDRTEEIRTNTAKKVATFSVGNIITFELYDETGCNENTGDPIAIEMTGKILSINGQHATVEHKYGICSTWLAIAHKAKLEQEGS